MTCYGINSGCFSRKATLNNDGVDPDLLVLQTGDAPGKRIWPVGPSIVAQPPGWTPGNTVTGPGGYFGGVTGGLSGGTENKKDPQLAVAFGCSTEENSVTTETYRPQPLMLLGQMVLFFKKLLLEFLHVKEINADTCSSDKPVTRSRINMNEQFIDFQKEAGDKTIRVLLDVDDIPDDITSLTAKFREVTIVNNNRLQKIYGLFTEPVQDLGPYYAETLHPLKVISLSLGQVRILPGTVGGVVPTISGIPLNNESILSIPGSGFVLAKCSVGYNNNNVAYIQSVQIVYSSNDASEPTEDYFEFKIAVIYNWHEPTQRYPIAQFVSGSLGYMMCGDGHVLGRL